MSQQSQAESVIKNIIREIVETCSKHGESVSETLVAFMVKATIIDPENHFGLEKTLSKEDVLTLIKVCVSKLLDKKSPALDTVKMQVYHDLNYTTRSELLEEHIVAFELRLQPIVREVTDSRARNRDELELLYRKVVSCILLRSGLGSPTEITIVREATAALQSIFPQNELGTFLALKKRDKETQLQEFTRIVTGIRLFNRDCGKGGFGIDDLPTILKEAISATLQSIEESRKHVVEKANCYTAILEKCQSENPINGCDTVDCNLLTAAMYNARQYEAFITCTQEDMVTSKEQVDKLLQHYSNAIQQLHNTVQGRSAVPTAAVYPLFIELSQAWTGFQNEMVVMGVLTNIYQNLLQFIECHEDLIPQEDISRVLEGEVVHSNEERRKLALSKGKVVPHDFPTMDFVFPNSVNNFEQFDIQYKGYCGWALVKFEGLLLPGNPDIGVLNYNNNFYTFCSKEAAYEFSQDPPMYITHVGDLARKHPELIQLLELHSQFATITPRMQVRSPSINKPVARSDGGTQTDTHIQEAYTDPLYQWNEWELRRKAMKLANLRTKLTHSTQTVLSHMKRDNATQVYLPRDGASQTKEDAATSVPCPHTFVAGLRGGGTHKSQPTVMTKVDLTLDIEQVLS